MVRHYCNNCDDLLNGPTKYEEKYETVLKPQNKKVRITLQFFPADEDYCADCRKMAVAQVLGLKVPS